MEQLNRIVAKASEKSPALPPSEDKPNRQRRRNGRSHDEKKSHVVGHAINSLRDSIRSQIQERNSKLSDSRSIVEYLYQDPCSIYPYLAHCFDLHQRINEGQNIARSTDLIDDKWLNSIRNVCSKTVNGTSIEDICKMDLPLSIDDISKINKVHRPYSVLYGFSRGRLGKMDELSLIAVESLYRLATASALETNETGKTTMPERLKPLAERVRNFYDYHVALLRNPWASQRQDFNLLAMWTFRTNFFPIAIGSYLPASLGITPASAAKLVLEKQESSLLPPYCWKQPIENLIPFFNDAIRPSIQSDYIRQAVLYNPERERVAADYLEQEYYRWENERADSDNNQQPDPMEKYRKFHRFINGGLKHQKEGEIIPTPKSEILESIIATKQNRKCNIFILKLRNESNIVIEINNQGEIYGLPSKLSVWEPQSRDWIKDVILTPVLAFYKSKYPQAEGYQPPQIVTLRPKEELPVLEVKQPTQSSSNKRKNGNDGLISALFGVEPVPQPRPVELTKVHKVNVDGDLKDVLGIADKDTLNRMKQALERFEYGLLEDKSLKDTPYTELRVGKRRILLIKQQGGEYLLEKFINRGQLKRRLFFR